MPNVEPIESLEDINKRLTAEAAELRLQLADSERLFRECVENGTKLDAEYEAVRGELESKVAELTAALEISEARVKEQAEAEEKSLGSLAFFSRQDPRLEQLQEGFHILALSDTSMAVLRRDWTHDRKPRWALVFEVHGVHKDFDIWAPLVLPQRVAP